MKSPQKLWPKLFGGGEWWGTNHVAQLYLGHYPRLFVSFLSLTHSQPPSLSLSLSLFCQLFFQSRIKKVYPESLMEKLDKVLCENFCVQELKFFSFFSFLLMNRFAFFFLERSEVVCRGLCKAANLLIIVVILAIKIIHNMWRKISFKIVFCAFNAKSSLFVLYLLS